MLTLAQAAAEIGVSKRWLQYWLAEHPVDGAGLPFYVPVGCHKRFERSDCERIKVALRKAVAYAPDAPGGSNARNALIEAVSPKAFSSAISIHELSISKIIARRPEKVHRRDFSTFLQKLHAKFDIWLDPEERFSRRPDAWSYEPYATDELPGTINLLEIEDTSPLSPEKLRDYADWWFLLDCDQIVLRLFVYDRYGEQERELDLQDYWFMFHQVDVPTPPTTVSRRSRRFDPVLKEARRKAFTRKLRGPSS